MILNFPESKLIEYQNRVSLRQTEQLKLDEVEGALSIDLEFDKEYMLERHENRTPSRNLYLELEKMHSILVNFYKKISLT